MMRSSIRVPVHGAACLLAAAMLSFAVLPAGAEGFDYAKDVRPILEAHCFKCHGPDRVKGKVRFDTLSTDFLADRAAAETWHDASDQIELGEMPPEDEDPLSEREREILVSWIDGKLAEALAAVQGETSGAVMRRLNRAEYQHTMHDLLGLDMDYASDLPADALSSDGFLNNGAALGMSALQIENYLASARKALDLILVEGEQPERRVEEVTLDPKNRRGRGLVGEVSERLGRVNFWRGSFQGLPRSGEFTIRITARVEKSEGQPAPVLAVDYGYFVSGLTVNLDEKAGEFELDTIGSKTYELRGRPEFFPTPEARVPEEKLNGVVTLRNVLDDGHPPPKAVSVEVEEKKGNKTRKVKKKVYPEDPDFPKVIIESVEFVSNDYADWPPPLHQRIVPKGEDLASDDAVARVLQSFLHRAWRRPPSSIEMVKWRAHYDVIREQSASDVEALRETLAAVLASPPFLYLVEPRPEGEKTRPLSDHELAARLSYFLWSSMPDAMLSRVADSGDLRRPRVLRQQFERMLADKRSERFVTQFTEQWLDLAAVDRVAVNPQYYPDFDEALKPDLVGETRAFFDEILRSDSSALLFLDADFTMLNAPLAKHYGLSGPTSQRFEKVPLNGTERPGGLLGHGSVLLAGSDGADSHPIKRAVWILERLLHDPPKPPPPNVPDLNSSVPGFAKLSIREQLAVHREKASCNDCHRGIDPWGIALEHYDAVGLWREKTSRGKQPVDTRTTLPGQHEIEGLADLQAFLLSERREQFSHALVSKLMTYALGRSLELADEPVIETLAHDFAEDGYRLAPLMEAIVKSETFLHR